MDPVIKEMVESGALDETQIPFDDSENEFKKEPVKKEISFPHTIKLDSPFLFGEEMVTEIVFQRKATAGMVMHLSIASERKYGHYVPVISKMSGKSEELIKEMQALDFAECVLFVSSFFI